jgi:hypothetical protein
MGLQIRPATIDDVDFLAWVILTASRSHLERGLWDIALGRDEEGCLSFLRELARAEPRSWAHYSRFIVAEVDGRATERQSNRVKERRWLLPLQPRRKEKT